MAVGELLLELTGQAGGTNVRLRGPVELKVINNLPLLRSVPALEERNRDEDDNSLATVSDLDL